MHGQPSRAEQGPTGEPQPERCSATRPEPEHRRRQARKTGVTRTKGQTPATKRAQATSQLPTTGQAQARPAIPVHPPVRARAAREPFLAEAPAQIRTRTTPQARTRASPQAQRGLARRRWPAAVRPARVSATPQALPPSVPARGLPEPLLNRASPLPRMRRPDARPRPCLARSRRVRVQVQVQVEQKQRMRRERRRLRLAPRWHLARGVPPERSRSRVPEPGLQEAFRPVRRRAKELQPAPEQRQEQRPRGASATCLVHPRRQAACRCR